MRRWLNGILVILTLVPVLSWADEGKDKKYVLWQTRDLYYHDANGTLVQLNLAPKLLVSFSADTAIEKRNSLLAEFSPIAMKEEPSDKSRTLVEFVASTSQVQLLEIANKISRSGAAKVEPVFVVENIEAVIAGITVEPKIIMTSERLLERIRKYGDLTSRQAVAENSSWVFLVDEVKPPLNILVLTNLISKDQWVSRAYPRFRFLHDPIVASVVVDPVSGTVGEVRTATLTVRVFDQAMELMVDQLPQFGEGFFRPIQGNPSDPSSIKYPPGYLFEVMGEPIKRPVKVEKRSRVYSTSRKFKQHALGEWVIHPQTVSYSKNGVTQEVKSSGFTMVVNSQIGNLKITDMPVPRPLLYPQNRPIAVLDVPLPPIPSYWFDKFVSDANRAFLYAMALGLIFVAAAAAAMSIPFARRTLRRNKMIEARHDKVARIRELFAEARSGVRYEKYYEVISIALLALFPNLAPDPTWDDIKGDAVVVGKLGSDTMVLLERVLFELGRRHSRNFAPTESSLSQLDRDISSILEEVLPMLLSAKEAE